MKQLGQTFAAALLSLTGFPQAAPSHPSGLTEIPPLGFGTWNLDRSNASAVVAAAFKTGYRHIDCAAAYGNEVEVGQGIKAGGVKREEFWVTSKLWNDHHRPDLVPKALDKTLSDLGLEYVDLYLMHWPVGDKSGGSGIDYIDTWKAMVELLSSGRTRHIGVSNFSPSQLSAILPIAKPYAHQYETHPYLPQTAFLDFHKTNGIRVTAYSPLGNQNPIYTSWRKEFYAEHLPVLLESPVVTEIAEARGCTPAQVVLKWGMLRGTSVIPKSKHADRIAENWASVDCDLEPADRGKLTSMARKRFNNPGKSWGVRLYQGLQDSTGLMGAVGDIVTWWKDEVVSSIAGLWKRYGSQDPQEL